MNIEFSATCYSAYTEDDVFTVGFADREDDPRHYLILQRAEEPDEQDVALGHDVCYVEIGEPGLAGYGGIDEVLIGTDTLVFTFGQRTPWCEGLRTVEIGISPALGPLEGIEASLRAVFTASPTNAAPRVHRAVATPVSRPGETS